MTKDIIYPNHSNFTEELIKNENDKPINLRKENELENINNCLFNLARSFYAMKNEQKNVINSLNVSEHNFN